MSATFHHEASSAAASSPVGSPRSAWHSPVPYLFGGLAAMLGLIAFALLILACSYWKLSGYLENQEEEERDLEAGEGEGEKVAPVVMEEKFLVIMAGQQNPTFLATPMSSRNSSFGSTKSCACSTSTSDNSGTTSFDENCEEEKNIMENGGRQTHEVANVEEVAGDQVH